MSSTPENGRINVSEDRLRGVLAEFEIRLRDFIEKKIEHKADQSQVDTLEKKHEKHDERIKRLEDAAVGRAAVSQWRKAWWALAVAAVGASWWMPELVHKLTH